MAPDTAPTATVAAVERRPVYFQPLHISTTKPTITADTAVTMVFLSTLASSHTPKGMAAQAARLIGANSMAEPKPAKPRIRPATRVTPIAVHRPTPAKRDEM